MVQHLDSRLDHRLAVGSLDEAGIDGYRAVLCDLDGCLIADGAPFPESAVFAERCGERLWIVSNDSASTAATLAARLCRMGLPVPAERIALAGEEALTALARRSGTRICLFASAEMERRADALGLVRVADAPDVVLLCRDPSFGLDEMQETLAAVAGGARLVVANTDASHPGQNGRPVPETGALLAALRAIAPGLLWESGGKPDPAMLRRTLERAGAAPSHAVFVGDNARTDGAAAAALELDFIHVRRMR